MKIHELKVDPQYFSQLMNCNKTCEVRYDDRGYNYGDFLILRQTIHSGEEIAGGMPLKYTGKYCLVKVTHIQTEKMPDKWCVLSVKLLDVGDWE